MSEKCILITGGAGFIGSHLADTMLERGFRVRILDSLVDQVHLDAEKDADGWPVYLDPRVERIHGSVTDEDAVRAAMQGATHLAHLAAAVGVGQSMSEMRRYAFDNTLGGATVLQVLRDGGHTIERMAVASSMAIYGEGSSRNPVTGEIVAPPPRPAEQMQGKRWEYEQDGVVLDPVPTKETKPLAPGTIYAITKRDHEEMFLVGGHSMGIPTIALRLFNVYGSRQALSNPYTGVAASFIARLLNGAPPLIFEDGGMRRDFVHVKDVASAFATVLEDERTMYDMFNVGMGGYRTVGQVADTLIDLLGLDIEPQILERYRIGDVRHCFADASKLADTFGFRATRSFEDGMEELIAWVQQAGKPKDKVEDSFAALEKNKLII